MANKSGTTRVQVSLDNKSIAYLDRIAQEGIKGKNRSEVAGRIIQDFLFENGAAVLEKMKMSDERLDLGLKKDP